MYKVRSKLALGLALTVIGSCAHAGEWLQPGSPLSGYQCYHIDAAALKSLIRAAVTLNKSKARR